MPREGAPNLPKVSEFYGIQIYIYWDEHGPPHFHAVYAEQEVKVSIVDLSVQAGYLSTRALGLVMEWAKLHQDELRHVWEQAARKEPLNRIDPLK